MNVKFLNESISSMRYLKDYIKKNLSGFSGGLGPFLNKNWKDFSPGYPDGTPSDWFVIGDVLFITGTKTMDIAKDKWAAVFVFEIHKEEKTITLAATRYCNFGFDSHTEKGLKQMTASMKSLVRKASKIKDAIEADFYINGICLTKDNIEF